MGWMRNRNWIYKSMHWSLTSIEDWNIIAQEVASRLHDGDILTLSGPLGAGKTTFAQALARTLGAERTPKSPTFSMLRTYAVSAKGLRRLLHVDAYRIENEVDLIPLDLDEELSIPGTILMIEWPEQIKEWLSMRPHLSLNIAIKGNGREVELED
jgi:tRNA threonylcarbamoyladenosine biosynthesis protein TsaE